MGIHPYLLFFIATVLSHDPAKSRHSSASSTLAKAIAHNNASTSSRLPYPAAAASADVVFNPRFTLELSASLYYLGRVSCQTPCGAILAAIDTTPPSHGPWFLGIMTAVYVDTAGIGG